MSIKKSIARTIRRLNLHGVFMKLPIFGQALYDGLSCEFDRVNDFRNIVKNSTVANTGIDDSTVEDYENKYGIIPISTDTIEQRKQRITEKAQRDGSGGADWFQAQIQSAGFPLYVHMNTKSVGDIPQYGNHQYGQILYGGSVNYLDPRSVIGEIVASSPNGNVGAQYLNYGNYQYGQIQYGTIIEGTSNPKPRPFTITSDPNRWGYFFFLSPFEDRLAVSSELLQLSEEQWKYLKRLIMQLKHLRNWAITQVEVVDNPLPLTIQNITTSDGFRLISSDGLSITANTRED